jgi:hypothetical protein
MDEPQISGSAQSLHGILLQCSVWNTLIPTSAAFGFTERTGAEGEIQNELLLYAHNDNTQDPELWNQHEQQSE